MLQREKNNLPGTQHYVGLFRQFLPGMAIDDNNYQAIQLRNLIIYFIYCQKFTDFKKNISTRELAKNFGLKSHTTVVRGINKIQKRVDSYEGQIMSSDFTRLYYKIFLATAQISRVSYYTYHNGNRPHN